MLQRPIGPLVDALRLIGSEITYLGEEGYPPLKIGAFTKQVVDVSVNEKKSCTFVPNEDFIKLIIEKFLRGMRF